MSYLSSTPRKGISHVEERHIRFELIPRGWKPRMLPLTPMSHGAGGG